MALAALLVAWCTACYAPERHWALDRTFTRVEPVLLGIRDVESSRCTDRREGGDGERTCYQIKPSTAHKAGCIDGWAEQWDGELARDCARRVMAWKQERCAALGFSRWDNYASAWMWNRGQCMKWADRPTGYELDVNYARLRHL